MFYSDRRNWFSYIPRRIWFWDVSWFWWIPQDGQVRPEGLSWWHSSWLDTPANPTKGRYRFCHDLQNASVGWDHGNMVLVFHGYGHCWTLLQNQEPNSYNQLYLVSNWQLELRDAVRGEAVSVCMSRCCPKDSPMCSLVLVTMAVGELGVDSAWWGTKLTFCQHHERTGKRYILFNKQMKSQTPCIIFFYHCIF